MDCLGDNYGVKFLKVVFSKVLFVGNEKSHRNFPSEILSSKLLRIPIRRLLH